MMLVKKKPARARPQRHLEPTFTAQLDAGLDLTDWHFYLDYEQLDGPRRLPDTIDFGGGLGPQRPICLFFAEEATTTSWPNRGSLGGDLTAINIRSQDVGLDTPFKDTRTKAVRCTCEAAGVDRYYEAANAVFADVDDEDLYFEAVYCRPSTATAPSAIFSKRNQGSVNNVGYHLSATSATAMQFSTREVGAGLPVRVAGVTTTTKAWAHVSGFFDASDTTVDGMRLFLGSQSFASRTAAATIASLTNTEKFRLGSRGLLTASDIDTVLCYVAIWRAKDMLPGPAATNTTVVNNIVRDRQMRMGGIVPQKGKGATTISNTARYNTRIRNGKAKSYRNSSGFCVSDDRFMADGTVKQSWEFYSQLNYANHTPEDFTSWSTGVGVSAPNTTHEAPCSPIISANGVVLTATAGGTGTQLSKFFSMAAGNHQMLNVFVKGGAGRYFLIYIADTAGNPISRYCYFDLVAGTIVTPGAGIVGACITPYENGWFLCSMVAPNPVLDTNTQVTLLFSLASGDGVTPDGYAYGFYHAAASAAYTTQHLPICLNENVVGPVHQYDGSDVSTAPHSYWWECFSPTSSPAPVVGMTGILGYTDANNYIGIGASSSTTSWILDTSGRSGSVTYWNLTPTMPAGTVNTPGSGGLVRSAVVCDTDNIRLLRHDGLLASSDAAAVVHTSPVSIRVGNSTSAAPGGRNIVHTRVGVAKTRLLNANGPAHYGQVDGHTRFMPLNEAAAPPRDLIIPSAVSTPSGSIVYGQPGVAGKAVDLTGGYIETDIKSMTGPFSWAARVTLLGTTTSGQHQFVLDQIVPGAAVNGNGVIVLIEAVTNKIAMILGGSTPTSTATITPNVPFVLALIFDGTTTRVFVDGIFVLSFTGNPFSVIGAGAPNMRLGFSSRSGFSGGPSNIRVEKLRVFNYAVPLPVLAQLYGWTTWTPGWLGSDAWWKAGAGNVTLDGSNGVSQWNDLSGNARHALQATAGNRPIYGVGAAQMNGKDTLRFTRASNTFLDVGDVMDLGTGNYSYAIAYRNRNNSSDQGFFGKTEAGVFTGRYGLLLEGTFGGGVLPRFWSIYTADTSGSGIVYVQPPNPVNTVAAAVGRLRREVGAGASVNELRLNRTASAVAFTDVAGAWNTAHPWRIGRYGTATAYDADVDIAELIFSLRRWTDAEVAQVENYLTAEWGTP